MIEVIPAHRRFSEDLGWLKTHWLFSFSHYYDPENLSFGALRVFNDDVVAPGSGFPDHPHANFEIVTIVLKGAIAHTDSMGNKAEVRAGEIQRMTAGRGVVHSEWNRGKEPVHLYQLWFLPVGESLKPGYAQTKALPAKPGGQLTLLVSGLGKKAPLEMNASADIYAGFLKKGVRLAFPLGADKGLFVYLGDGSLAIGDQRLSSGDQARVRGEPEVTLESKGESHALFIHTKLF